MTFKDYLRIDEKVILQPELEKKLNKFEYNIIKSTSTSITINIITDNIRKKVLSEINLLLPNSEWENVGSSIGRIKVLQNDGMTLYIYAKSPTNNSKISFGGGENTKIGESIQNIGLYLSESDLNSKDLYSMIKNYTNNKDLNLSHPDGIVEKYMKDPETFNKYRASFIQILYASVQAKKEILLNNTKSIHLDIQKYYNILKKHKDTVSKNIKKENTADMVLYTGDNFLNNLENGKIISEDNNWIIKIFIDGKITNEFVQISLKSGGRIGDSKILTDIAKKFKFTVMDPVEENYIIYSNSLNEGFTEFIQKSYNYVKNIFKKLSNRLLSFFDKKFSKIEDELFNEIMKNSKFNENLNEKKFDSFAKEKMIWDEFKTDKKYYIKLFETKYAKSLDSIKNKLSSFGEQAKIKIEGSEYLKVPLSVTSEELRLIYYNIVSIQVFDDYIHTVTDLDDILKIEQALVIGNTTLPLIKIEASGNNPIEFIQIKKIKSPPKDAIGLLINKTKQHLSFYIFIISSLKQDDKYLKIQMRTSGNQYKIDGQSYISEKEYNNYMS